MCWSVVSCSLVSFCTCTSSKRTDYWVLLDHREPRQASTSWVTSASNISGTISGVVSWEYHPVSMINRPSICLPTGHQVPWIRVNIFINDSVSLIAFCINLSIRGWITLRVAMKLQSVKVYTQTARLSESSRSNSHSYPSGSRHDRQGASREMGKSINRTLESYNN